MATVRVIYHEEPDGWWAESPDVDGFGAAGESLEEVRRLAADGISFYLEADSVELDERFPTTVVSSRVTGFVAGGSTETRNAAVSRVVVSEAAVPSRLHASRPTAA